MATDVKISAMPDGGSIEETDQIPVVRDSLNYRVHVGSAAGLDAGGAIGDVPLLSDISGNPALPALDASLLYNLKRFPINMTLNASALTLSAIPATTVFAGGAPRLINQYDISRFTLVRMNVMLGTVAGPAGSKIVAKYKYAPFTAVVADWLDLGVTEVSLPLNVTTNYYYETPWIDIANLARNDVFLGIFTTGGNGSSNPVVNNVNLQFK